jgi:hypothetical protein
MSLCKIILNEDVDRGKKVTKAKEVLMPPFWKLCHGPYLDVHL